MIRYSPKDSLIALVSPDRVGVLCVSGLLYLRSLIPIHSLSIPWKLLSGFNPYAAGG